ncbi:MAG: hypothetical protein WAV76_09525 [Bacteroidota bacterium]
MTRQNPNAEETSELQFNADAQLKIELAHDVVQHSEKFAEIFCKAAATQVSVKQLIRKEIRDTLSTDAESINFLKGIIEKHFKDNWRAFARTAGGRILFAIWTLLVAIVSAWLAHYFR